MQDRELPKEDCGPPVLYSSIPKYHDRCPTWKNAPNLLCNDTIEMVMEIVSSITIFQMIKKPQHIFWHFRMNLKENMKIILILI